MTDIRALIIKAITDDAQLPLDERQGIVGAVVRAVRLLFSRISAERDDAYRERARLVAHLASRYPSHIGCTDPSAPDWPVVIIETPAGQLSWHVAPTDVELFEHVMPTHALHDAWDGHTTEEKYGRLEQLIREGM